MIEIRNCTKRYGDLVAVDNLSLHVGRSEIFGFLGPNGAGKSTTIKMMVGLLRPDRGEIKIAGHDMFKDPLSAKRKLAYVPEKGYLFERLTAWEYLKFTSGIFALDEAIFRENAERYLEIFGLKDWKKEIIGNFSMGMRQRLLLTSSFMRDPDILILDEPHNGLDPKGVRILRDVLFDLKDRGKAVLLSTHIIAIAEQICDRISIMHRGAIAAEGTREDLKGYALSKDKTLEDIFLQLTTDLEVSP